MLKGAFATSFLVVLIVPTFLATPGFAQEDLEELFNEGVSLYNRGQLEDALQSFQAVLAENPSHELAFNFLNKAGHQVLIKMMLERGDYENVAKRFFELASAGRREKQEDGDRIQELVGQVVGGDQRERTEAFLKLAADHGEYTVEYIYEELTSEDLEARVNVMTGLVRMGEEVVLPLIEVLHGEDALIRRNAAAVLGNIGDPRAKGALKMMADRDEEPLNRDVAGESFEKIMGDAASSVSSPEGFFLDLARAYLNKDDSLFKPYMVSRVVWKWRDGRLTKSPVAPGLYNLELAEEACFQALKCAPGSPEALALLAFTYAAQRAETDAARLAAGDDPESLSEAMVSAALKLQNVGRNIAVTGPAALNGALEFALQGGHSLPAVQLIWILSETNTKAPALEKSLQSESKLVKYAAAVALAKMGVKTQQVVATLVGALRESAVQNVLVIDDQSNSRNILLNELSGEGYFAVGADSGALGLLRAKSFPRKDLIILRVDLNDITTDKVVYEMAEGDTAEVPIMLLVDQGDLEDVQGIWEGKVGGFISSPPNKAAFLADVQANLGEVMNRERELAMNISQEAAQTLAAMQPELLAPHKDAFISALDKADAVKVPVLNVLSHLGEMGALEKVKGLFQQEDIATEVRVAAAGALGAIFTKMDGAPDGEVLAALVAALGSDEPQLSTAAGAALGKAKVLPEDFLGTVLAEHRID